MTTLYNYNIPTFSPNFNRCFLVGFISDESFAQIGTIDKSKGLEVIVFSFPFKHFKNATSIPVNSISKIKWRELDFDKDTSIRVLDITAKKS